jgi:uncharacterized RDD family membrane protein YckC
MLPPDGPGGPPAEPPPPADAPPGYPPPPPGYGPPQGYPPPPGYGPPQGYPPPAGYGSAPGPAPGLVYADVWTRLAAYIIDLVIMGLVGLVIRIPLAYHASAVGAYVILVVVQVIVHGVYLVTLWQRGQTLGMRVLGLSVLRAGDGGRLTLDEAFRRFVLFALALVTAPIGALIWLAMAITVASDGRGQGLHDRMAGSVVVRRVG